MSYVTIANVVLVKELPEFDVLTKKRQLFDVLIIFHIGMAMEQNLLPLGSLYLDIPC
jgi:hypothetical protein